LRHGRNCRHGQQGSQGQCGRVFHASPLIHSQNKKG
jgi:hypothetical protein